MTPEFGAPSSLSVSQVAYGLWIYYRLAKTTDWNDDFTLRWFEAVRESPRAAREGFLVAIKGRCAASAVRSLAHTAKWVWTSATESGALVIFEY